MAVRRADLAGYGLRLAVVAAAYFFTAQLGLQLAVVHRQVTPVWPPTGIALVAILVLGVRIWPAIALAALAVNIPLGPNPVGAGVIAAGNTLAPLTAAYLMKQAGFRLELDRLGTPRPSSCSARSRAWPSAPRSAVWCCWPPGPCRKRTLPRRGRSGGRATRWACCWWPLSCSAFARRPGSRS